MNSFRVFVFLLFTAVAIATPVKDAEHEKLVEGYVSIFAILDCTTEITPICGKDGFTYPNRCYFNKLRGYLNAAEPIEAAHFGFCGNDKDALIQEAMHKIRTMEPDPMLEILKRM